MAAGQGIKRRTGSWIAESFEDIFDADGKERSFEEALGITTSAGNQESASQIRMAQVSQIQTAQQWQKSKAGRRISHQCHMATTRHICLDSHER
jgi:hypothetical protein